MPRAATLPAEQADALSKNALPKAKKLGDDPIKFTPMAKLLGISPNTLKLWLRDEFPELAQTDLYQPGGNGVQYQFRPHGTVKFIINHFRAKSRKQRAKTKRLIEPPAKKPAAKKRGSKETDEDSPEELDYSLAEMRAALDVRERIVKQMAREGQLIERSVVESAVSKMFDQMQQAHVNAAHEQDPTGQWPPDIAEAFTKALENIMLAEQKAFEECLGELRGAALS